MSSAEAQSQSQLCSWCQVTELNLIVGESAKTCHRPYFLLLESPFLEIGICLLQLLNCPAVVTAARSSVGGWKKEKF